MVIWKEKHQDTENILIGRLTDYSSILCVYDKNSRKWRGVNGEGGG